MEVLPRVPTMETSSTAVPRQLRSFWKLSFTIEVEAQLGKQVWDVQASDEFAVLFLGVAQLVERLTVEVHANIRRSLVRFRFPRFLMERNRLQHFNVSTCFLSSCHLSFLWSSGMILP